MAISKRRLRRKAKRIVEQDYGPQRDLIQQDISARQQDLGSEISSLQSMQTGLQQGINVGRAQVQSSPDLLGRDRKMAVREYGARSADVVGGTRLAIGQAQHQAQEDITDYQRDLQKLAIEEGHDIRAKTHSLMVKAREAAEDALPTEEDIEQKKEFRDSLKVAGQLYRDGLANEDVPGSPEDWEDFTGAVAKRSLGTTNDAILAVRKLQMMLRDFGPQLDRVSVSRVPGQQQRLIAGG